MPRTAPLPAYNYHRRSEWTARLRIKPLGGFSDVSGLETDIHISEYRDGNEAEPHVRKIPGSHKVGDVTLKRGVVNSSDLWAWITATRKTGVAAQRDVVITLLDEAGNSDSAMEAAQGGAHEVYRPHAGGQRRRRGRHGRAGAVRRRVRDQSRFLSVKREMESLRESEP